MRNMSYYLTVQQYLDGTKDTSRRILHFSKRNPKEPVGWAKLKVGEHYSAVEKSQGLKKGERVRYLGQNVCVYNKPESLNEIIKRPYREGSERSEMEREGLGHLTAKEFVEFFIANSEKNTRPTTVVNVIRHKKFGVNK